MFKIDARLLALLSIIVLILIGVFSEDKKIWGDLIIGILIIINIILFGYLYLADKRLIAAIKKLRESYKKDKK